MAKRNTIKKTKRREYKRRPFVHGESERKPTIPFIIALVNSILTNVRFVDFIDESVDWDQSQWKVSPGNLAKALVLSTFFDVRAPLCRVSDNFRDIDTEFLFGEGVTWEHLNEYALAEALDRIAEAKPNKLFATLSLSARTIYSVAFKILHTDTTSGSFYGEYDLGENPEEESESEDILGISDKQDATPIKIEKGYNKDDRKGCKQYVYGKAVDEHGVPIFGFAMDGGTSDSMWNKKMIEHLQDNYETLAEGRIVVGDSKLINADIMEKMLNPKKTINFISRCPANFYGKLESTAIEKAYLANDWKDVGKFGVDKNACTYSAWECVETFEGNPVRLVVVKSSEGYKRYLTKKVEQLKNLEEDVKQINKKTFACKADAVKEWERFAKVHKNGLYDCTVDYKETVVEKFKKGRPAKDAKPLSTEAFWSVAVEITGENKTKADKFLQSEESFVLITNTNKETLGIQEIIGHYKGQIRVERDFKLFKDPSIAEVIYLKTPERIGALVMLMGVSLLLRGLIQYKLRKGYKKAIENNVKLPRVGWRNQELKGNLTAFFMTVAMRGACFVETEEGYASSFQDEKSKMRIVTLLQLMDMEVADMII